MGGALDNSAASTQIVCETRFLLHIWSEGKTATSPDASWATLPYSVCAAVEHACCNFSRLMAIKEKHERDEGVDSMALNKSKNMVERCRHVTRVQSQHGLPHSDHAIVVCQTEGGATTWDGAFHDRAAARHAHNSNPATQVRSGRAHSDLSW